MNQKPEMLSNEKWQNAEQLSEEKKMKYIQEINRSSKATRIAILVILAILLFPIVIILLMSFNIWLVLTAVVLLLGTWLFFCKARKDDNLLIKDINENNFKFFIEEARHIDEHDYVNKRINKHYGSVFLTNDVLFMKTGHFQNFFSFTYSSEDKTKSRIENIDWYLSIELEKPDSLKLDEYLKTALEKADGVYIPRKGTYFSAKAYQDKKISLGKKSVFWYYEDSKQRDKRFPKAFQWAFSVAEGMRYVTESNGEDSEVVMRNLYASGLNCQPCYVNAGDPVILIRDLATDRIQPWALKFE